MKNNSLILKNAIFLAIRTFLITFVGLYSVRELLKLLGVEGFGIFNLIFGVAVLFSFLNGALVSSSQRYLSYYIGNNDSNMLECAWNNSIFLHFLVGLLVSLLLFLCKNIVLIDILVIPSGYYDISYLLYYCAIASIFISIIQTPFNALVLANEKMSFFALISLIDAFLKLLVIFLLYFFEDKILERYAFFYLFSSFIIFLIYNLYCFFYFKKIIIFSVRNYSLLKDMLFFSFWSIFGNLAFVTKTQGINILLNMFIGIIANSSYTIAANITSAVSNLINSIVTAINPQIYKTYAEKNYKRNIFLIKKSSKFCFFLGLLAVFPILFNTNYILNLIFDENPRYLTEFVQLALVIVLIDCLSGSIMTGIQATGKIKAYQIGVSILIFMNLPLSYFSLKYFSNPNLVYWVGIFISIFSLLVRIYFLKRLIEFSMLDYFYSVLLKGFYVLISSIIMILFFESKFSFNNECFDFIFSTIFIVLSLLISIILFGLDKHEKNFSSKLILKFFNK